MVFSVSGRAADVRLAWNGNTESDIAGYKVYYGTASKAYDWVLDIGKVTTCTVTGLTTGRTYYFAVTAYDTSNLESTYSNEVSTTTCTYSISPISQSFTSSGGTGSISVSTQSACSWTANSGASWLTITSGNSGTGNGTVGYSIAANGNSSSRTASSTIAKNTFTVTQEGSGIATYTITASAGTGGTISPSGAVTVNKGANRSFTITPNTGYSISGVTVDGASVGAVSSYTFNNVTANHTISASFTANPTKYTLTIKKTGSGSGTVINNPSGSMFSPGTVVNLVANPNSGSSFAGWSGGCSGTTQTCKVTMNSNISVTASFVLKEAPSNITITSPDGGETLSSGSTLTITWTAPPEAIRFNLFYSTNNGFTWKMIARNLTGSSYQWRIPAVANNKLRCKIMVVGYNEQRKKIASEISSGTFTIQVVRVTSLNGGQQLVSGSSSTIQWKTYSTARDVVGIKLFYTLNGGKKWKKIESLTNNPGSYAWAVPDINNARTECKVKVVLKAAGDVTAGSDESDGFFSISPAL